jgi:hypothetical protein
MKLLAFSRLLLQMGESGQRPDEGYFAAMRGFGMMEVGIS